MVFLFRRFLHKSLKYHGTVPQEPSGGRGGTTSTGRQHRLWAQPWGHFATSWLAAAGARRVTKTFRDENFTPVTAFSISPGRNKSTKKSKNLLAQPGLHQPQSGHGTVTLISVHQTSFITGGCKYQPQTKSYRPSFWSLTCALHPIFNFYQGVEESCSKHRDAITGSLNPA